MGITLEMANVVFVKIELWLDDVFVAMKHSMHERTLKVLLVTLCVRALASACTCCVFAVYFPTIDHIIARQYANVADSTH